MTVYWQSKSRILQSLLADRFKLRVHEVTKQLPVYEIVVAKGGPKLKAFNKSELGADHVPGRGLWGREGVARFVGVRLLFLAGFLSERLGRLVIDKTRLTGSYNFTLTGADWRAGMGEAHFGWRQGLSEPVNSGPLIFMANQEQLGLNLKPAKGPVQVLVVDHIDPPTPN